MRKSFASLLFVVVIGAAGTACVASAGYSASATMPSMAYVGPDVQVIEDYDEPVFYSSSLYWRYDGGVWYQSRTHTGGWARATPPAAVLRIQQPSMYVHYHASASGGAQAHASGGQPEHHEAKAEQHEVKAEQHEEKRDAQQERREDKQERREEKDEHGHKK